MKNWLGMFSAVLLAVVIGVGGVYWLAQRNAAQVAEAAAWDARAAELITQLRSRDYPRDHTLRQVVVVAAFEVQTAKKHLRAKPARATGALGLEIAIEAADERLEGARATVQRWERGGR